MPEGKKLCLLIIKKKNAPQLRLKNNLNLGNDQFNTILCFCGTKYCKGNKFSKVK